MPGRKIRPLYKKSSSPSDLCLFKPGRFPLTKTNYSQVEKTPLLCVCVYVCVSPSNIRKIKGVIECAQKPLIKPAQRFVTGSSNTLWITGADR